jgi:uncharacterized FAD-dependent dehydrogenase
MSPCPTPLPNGVPQWTGALLVGVSVLIIGGGTMASATNLSALNVKIAEQKAILQMLCDFMEEKKTRDNIQDERLRQLELRVQALGR